MNPWATVTFPHPSFVLRADPKLELGVVALLDLGLRIRDEQQRVLLRLARAGNERAFRCLYRQLYGPVSGYVAARIRSTDDAEDLVSEIFRKFLRGMQRYDPQRSSVWTWVMSLARYSVIDFYRTHHEAESLEGLADVLASDEADALSRLVEDEEARLLHGILRGHPAEIREMFALRFGEGMRYGEIAVLLNLSEDAVKQRFSRAMRQLRSEWKGRAKKGGENGSMALETGCRVEDPAWATRRVQ